jgi:hypothetical protein
MKPQIQLSDRNRYIFFCTLALVQFIAQTGALLKGTEYVICALTLDDTYYYLQTAWNLKHLGIPSFDGIHPTNGVQLLWFGVVFLLAQISQTKTGLLFLSIILCFVLNAGSFLAIWKFSETAGRPILGIYMGSFWFLLTFGSRLYSSGLENSLHAFIFWLAILQTLAFVLERDKQKKKRRFILLTVILVLNVWARLDAAIFSAILYVYCLFNLDKRENSDVIVLSALLASVGLVVQLTVFHQLGGSWLPVSGLVKQKWWRWGHFDHTARLLMFALLLLPLLEAIIHRYSRVKQESSLRSLWYCLLIGVMVHVMVTGGIDAYARSPWHLSPSLIFLALTLAYLGEGAGQLLSQFAPAAGRVSPVVLSLSFLIISVIYFQARLTTCALPSHKLAYRSALWISEHLPGDARLASWNAGIFGYFSDRTVINLDGLINGVEYYQQVINGPKPWTEYVKEQNVDFIIDYERFYVTTPEFPIARTFVLADYDKEVVMWGVRSADTGKPAYQQVEFSDE